MLPLMSSTPENPTADEVKWSFSRFQSETGKTIFQDTHLAHQFVHFTMLAIERGVVTEQQLDYGGFLAIQLSRRDVYLKESQAHSLRSLQQVIDYVQQRLYTPKPRRLF